MKVLVTGAAGFIGFHVARRLLERGDEVVGLDSINDYYDVGLKYGRLAESGIERARVAEGVLIPSSKSPAYRFVKLDLTHGDRLRELFDREEFTAVCHLAAQAGVRYGQVNPQAYVESNLVGFANTIDQARRHGVGHFVYASSSSVYGLNEKTPFSTRDNVDHPISLYAATKKSNELVAHSSSYLFGLPTTGLRFFTVYGPWGRPDMAYFLFTESILEGRPIDVYNHGDMSRDFTYIDDAIDGIVRVIDAPPTGDGARTGQSPDPSRSRAPYRIYNIGNGRPVNLMTFIKEIEKSLGRTAHINNLPLQPGDVPITWADTSDLEKDFGFRPQTPLAKGLANFIKWYLDFYK